jgi:hypothetical protein
MQAAIPCKIKSQSTPTVYAWLLQSISLTPLVGGYPLRGKGRIARKKGAVTPVMLASGSRKNAYVSAECR